MAVNGEVFDAILGFKSILAKHGFDVKWIELGSEEQVAKLFRDVEGLLSDEERSWQTFRDYMRVYGVKIGHRK